MAGVWAWCVVAGWGEAGGTATLVVAAGGVVVVEGVEIEAGGAGREEVLVFVVDGGEVDDAFCFLPEFG